MSDRQHISISAYQDNHPLETGTRLRTHKALSPFGFPDTRRLGDHPQTGQRYVHMNLLESYSLIPDSVLWCSLLGFAVIANEP